MIDLKKDSENFNRKVDAPEKDVGHFHARWEINGRVEGRP
jgi:hypothetical protein